MASAPLHLARSFTLGPSHTRCSPSSSATFLGGFFISSSSLPDVRLCTASSINNMKPAIASLRPNCDVGKSWTQKFTPMLDVGYTTLAELVITRHRGYVYRPEWCSCRRKWGLSANARQSIVRMSRKTTVIDRKTWPFKFIIKHSLQQF